MRAPQTGGLIAGVPTALVGQRVLRYRILRGITQQKLADTVGCSRSYIARFERGTRGNFEMLAKIAPVLWTNVITLLMPHAEEKRHDQHRAEGRTDAPGDDRRCCPTCRCQ